MIPIPRLFLLLMLALPLAGCLFDDDTPAPALQSLETEDGAGLLTSVTYLDRDARGQLTQVRHYTGAGEDGLWKTGDDVLAKYVVCQNGRTGQQLRDPLAELEGAIWLGDRFTTRNCALDERASSIHNETFVAAGADGLWFTGDDVAEPAITLQRTASGHRRTVTAPSCGVNCSNTLNSTGLTNIVYNPYAGLDTGNTQTLAAYGSDSTGLVQRLVIESTSLRYEFDGARALQRKVLENSPTPALPDSGNIVLDLLLLGDKSVYEQYDRQDDGSYLARFVVRMDADVFDSASPTGQILLTILGWTGPVVEVDGVRYMDVTRQRIRAISAHGLPQQLALLSSPGDDGIWGNDDDGVAQRQRYFYK